MNSIELGKFIANLRNEKHLTQEDLADKLFNVIAPRYEKRNGGYSHD